MRLEIALKNNIKKLLLINWIVAEIALGNKDNTMKLIQDSVFLFPYINDEMKLTDAFFDYYDQKIAEATFYMSREELIELAHIERTAELNEIEEIVEIRCKQLAQEFKKYFFQYEACLFEELANIKE